MGYFKTTQDGRKLLFLRGTAYVIASEQDYQRLRQQFKIYNRANFIAALAVSLAAGYFAERMDVVACVLTIIAGYLVDLLCTVWMRRLLSGLEVSNERLSFREWWSGTLKQLKPTGPWTVQDPPVPSSGKVSD
ncbi:hypothetical protein JQ543_10235 [Bradyrhizobium diazoefficiens]|nr:hypothetical protein [Bradyrhizobium diazoefficiens]MBR0848117.1 hypothetical protein [Bradyrhizobium diazoefficiens]